MTKKTTRPAGADTPALPSRRHFLGGAAVAAPSVAVTAPPPPSPVAAMFEEWRAERDRISAIPDKDDETFERLYAGLDAIELRIRQTPAESHSDVAVKIAMWFETSQPIGWEMAEQGDWQSLMLLAAYKDAKRLGGAV